MPSPEIEALLDIYVENMASPEERLKVCEKLQALGDPEAIPELVVIYQQDVDADVRQKAGDALKAYRVMQRRLEREAAERASASSSLRTLQWLLTFSLVILIAANAILFVLGMDKETVDPDAERRALINKVTASIDQILTDAQGLQEELRKIDPNAPVGSLPNCTREFIHPQPLVLNTDEAQKFPDIQQIVDTDLNNFALTGLNLVFNFWDNTVCAGRQYQATEISANINRLQGVIDTATNVRNRLVPPSPSQAIRDRQTLINQIASTLDSTISDAQALQQELGKIALNSGAPDCARQFARPQAISLSTEEAQQYPDIQTFVANEVDFSLSGLQQAFIFWDSICSGQTVQSVDAATYINRLIAVIDTATAARNAGIPNLSGVE